MAYILPKPNMNTTSLTVTKEAVLKAAEQCPQAKTVLETLFPTAFDINIACGDVLDGPNHIRCMVIKIDYYKEHFMLVSPYSENFCFSVSTKFNSLTELKNYIRKHALQKVCNVREQVQAAILTAK